jgi:hypothetical protein
MSRSRLEQYESNRGRSRTGYYSFSRKPFSFRGAAFWREESALELSFRSEARSLIQKPLSFRRRSEESDLKAFVIPRRSEESAVCR